jgi:uncharacterized protein (DUF58 family)
VRELSLTGSFSLDRRARTWNPLHEQAEQLAASLPPLLVEAERLAASVSLGVHGRRKAGMGESFWQFRRYAPEDPAAAVDWRQSAKSQHLFVREREWEAAQAVWFWRDASPGMRFKSQFSDATKMDRATVLALALASLLVRGGERIALFGRERPPASGRIALERMTHELTGNATGDAVPPDAPISSHAQIVWLSDFLSPPEAIEAAVRRLSGAGASGHLVRIIDPAEEDFPFVGRTRFEAPAQRETELFGRAEAVRDGYRARFRAHGEAIAALARRLGWSYLAHRTDKGPNLALIALYAALGGEAAQRTA